MPQVQVHPIQHHRCGNTEWVGQETDLHSVRSLRRRSGAQEKHPLGCKYHSTDWRNLMKTIAARVRKLHPMLKTFLALFAILLIFKTVTK